MCFVAVSAAAWEVIEEVNYIGYDAYLPFRTAQRDFYFPYTPYWHGTAALQAGAQLILDEGLENCFARHARVAETCRQRLVEIGYTLFPTPGAVHSPTVTAANVPENIAWPEFDRRLRQRGLVVGGSYGPLANKVFRLGHMGSQADLDLLQQALDVLEKVLKQ
jgi:aspartate aminotransferase-like enzyme